MSDYNEKKQNEYFSDDDQYQESIVGGHDRRHKIDFFKPTQDDIYECIGQLDVVFDYDEKHMFTEHSISTGTVIFVGNVSPDNECKTAVILTCAHNVRCNVIHCSKENCNTYRRKKDSKGYYTECRVCKEITGVDQKEIIIKATTIKFLNRSIEYNNYGETLGNYLCKEIYVPNKEYMNNPKPKDGFDCAFLEISDSKAVQDYEQKLRRINIELVDGMTTCKQEHKYGIFGYPGEKDNKMFGMISANNQFKIERNAITKQHYIHQTAVDTSCGESGSLVWYKKQDDKKIKVCGIHAGGDSGKRRNTKPYNVATIINETILKKWKYIKDNRTLLCDDIKEQENKQISVESVGIKDVEIKISSDQDEQKETQLIFSMQMKEKNEYAHIDHEQQFELKENNKVYKISGLLPDTNYLLQVKRGHGVQNDKEKTAEWWSDGVITTFRTQNIVDCFAKCGDKIKINEDEKTISNDTSANSWDTAYGNIEIDCTKDERDFTIYSWEFKINTYYAMWIGIDESSKKWINNKPNKRTVNYFLRHTGECFTNNHATHDKRSNEIIVAGDTVLMTLDLLNQTLTYSKNGNRKYIAKIGNIKIKDVKYNMAIYCYKKSGVTLMEFNVR